MYAANNREVHLVAGAGTINLFLLGFFDESHSLTSSQNTHIVNEAFSYRYRPNAIVGLYDSPIDTTAPSALIAVRNAIHIPMKSDYECMNACPGTQPS